MEDGAVKEVEEATTLLQYFLVKNVLKRCGAEVQRRRGLGRRRRGA